MTAKEVLYDSETLLRLVDSEIEELRADLPANAIIAISPLKLVSPQSNGPRQTEVGTQLHYPKRCP